MFDAGCNRMLLVDKPVVTCEAVSKLKVLLAGASNDDPIVKEAQRFEGGVDASETKFKTTHSWNCSSRQFRSRAG